MPWKDDGTERDLNEELPFHLDMETQANVGRGMNPPDARRQARQDAGGLEQAKEHHRDARRGRWARDFSQDVRHACRRQARIRY